MRKFNYQLNSKVYFQMHCLILLLKAYLNQFIFKKIKLFYISQRDLQQNLWTSKKRNKAYCFGFVSFFFSASSSFSSFLTSIVFGAAFLPINSQHWCLQSIHVLNVIIYKVNVSFKHFNVQYLCDWQKSWQHLFWHPWKKKMKRIIYSNIHV